MSRFLPIRAYFYTLTIPPSTIPLAMPIKIEFAESDHLPRLAWGAKYEIKNQKANIIVGNGVEICREKGALVEGAWDGDFENFNFHQSTAFIGTGVRKVQGELLVCGSTDRMAPLFSVHMEDEIYFSNSINFVLCMSQTSFLPLYPYYHHDILAMIREGLYCLDGTTPLKDGHHLHIHFSNIAAIQPNGEVNYRTYGSGEAPSSYESYRSILQKTMDQVLKNGADPARTHPLKSIATISTGYDSPATAAIARDAGCRDAITFYDSKSDQPHADNGSKNAASLGMSCKEFDRWEFKNIHPPVEPEFCFMAGTSNAPWAAMENELTNSILICGHYGGDVWDNKKIRHMDKLSSAWSRSGAGYSQFEFRLRVGYICIDPSLIALRHSDKLAEIFNSEEMQPWSVGGEYDRPAARRIAEEAGIPREQFGMKKRKTSHSGMKKKEGLSEKGYESYTAFCEKSANESSKLSWLYWRSHYAITYFIYYKLTSSSRKICASTPIRRKLPYLLNAAPLRLTWKFLFSFQWGYNELKGRYQKSLSDEKV